MSMPVIYELWRTTPSELRSAFPGWREPLSAPRVVRRPNAFTGTMVDEESWDPTPETPVEDAGPEGVPFETIPAGMDPDHFSLLCRAIGRNAEGGGDFALRPALIGPPEGARLFLVPPALRKTLAAFKNFEAAAAIWLDEEERHLPMEVRSKAARANRVRASSQYLLELAVFFDAAATEQQEVYFRSSM